VKRLLIGAAALALATGAPAHAQMVSAPGGWPWFEVSRDGMEIEEATATSGTPQIIIKADQPTGDAKELQPAGNLGTISRLTLSPDDQTLYFETTPNGYDGTVRSFDLKTGKFSTFNEIGDLTCVVLEGNNQGYLIIKEYLIPFGGLITGEAGIKAEVEFSPDGKQVGIVAYNGDLTTQKCQTLFGP
jgi:WD40 repeat protein